MTSAIEKVLLARQDHLEHYGVKGMKWGVRKDRLSGVSGNSITEDDLDDLFNQVDQGELEYLDLYFTIMELPKGDREKILDHIIAKKPVRHLLGLIQAEKAHDVSLTTIGEPGSVSYEKRKAEALLLREQMAKKREAYEHIEGPKNLRKDIFNPDAKIDTSKITKLAPGGTPPARDLPKNPEPAKLKGVKEGPKTSAQRPNSDINARVDSYLKQKKKEREATESLKHAVDFNNSLEHYGVLGMKWGVRKDRYRPNDADKSQGLSNFAKTYGRPMIVGDTTYAIRDDQAFLMFASSIQTKKISKLGSIQTTDLKHVLTLKLEPNKAPEELKVIFTDKKNLRALEKLPPVEHSIEHEETLQHWGVLGMKWGRRKSRDGTYKTTEQVLAEEKRTAKTKSSAESIRKSNGNKRFSSIQVQNRKGNAEAFMYDRKKVTLKQTQNGIVVEGRKEKDVRKVLEELRKIQGDGKVEKKSTGTVEMSNEDLRATIDRMRLERDYAQLTAPPAPKPRSRPLKDFMIRTGTQVAGQVAAQVGVAYLTKASKININKVISPEYRVDPGKILKDD